MIDLTTLRPVLKGEKIQAPAKKAANLPGFAQILGRAFPVTLAPQRQPYQLPLQSQYSPCNQLQRAPEIRKHRPAGANLHGKRITCRSNQPQSPARATRWNSHRCGPRLIAPCMSSASGNSPNASMQAVPPSAGFTSPQHPTHPAEREALGACVTHPASWCSPFLAAFPARQMHPCRQTPDSVRSVVQASRASRPSCN